MFDFTFREPVHRQAHEPSGTGPGRRVDITSNRPGDDEAPPPGLIVDGQLDDLKRLGHLLPLVDEDWLWQAFDDGARIYGKCLGHRWIAQPNGGGRVLLAGGGFARGSGSNHEHCGMVLDHLAQHFIG